MEEGLNGQFKDEVHQNVEDGIKAKFDDEGLGMDAEEGFEVNVNRVENGKEEKDLTSSSSSSSDDEEAEIIVTVKTDEEEAEVFVTEKIDDETGIICHEENRASDLIVEEEAAEIDSNPVTEELKVAEVTEDINEVEVIADEENRSSVEESQTVEVVAVELAEVEPDKVESAKEVFSTAVKEGEVEYADPEDINGKLQSAEEDSFRAIAKPSNGTDDTIYKTEIPETNGNPIISISARTMQPTSWRGCCGLLEVFKRGDR